MKLDGNTPISMNLKNLGLLLLGMLSVFFLFYQLVVAPKLEDHDRELVDMKKTQTERYENINRQLMEISNGIGTINGNIDGINNRFNDLRDLREAATNTGGSLN